MSIDTKPDSARARAKRNFQIRLTTFKESFIADGGFFKVDACTQTDSDQYWAEVKEGTEKHWEMEMDTTIRMKFEQLKVMHLREMENIMTELNAERHFRAE